ncbi:MAG: hypothetical protein C0592_07520 [Marinilabiliales bacterium]|nr:MAG: hypothetical protein C0592_07520 [Marinilabiliales bacterium]
MKRAFFAFAILFIAAGAFAAPVAPDNETDTIYQGQNLNEEVMLFIPNAFSPNGDGRNDYFAPVGAGITIDYFEMRIYSRRGQLIYLSTDINQPWNGDVQGRRYDETATEVFVYHITIRTNKGFTNEFFGRVLRIP